MQCCQSNHTKSILPENKWQGNNHPEHVATLTNWASASRIARVEILLSARPFVGPFYGIKGWQKIRTNWLYDYLYSWLINSSTFRPRATFLEVSDRPRTRAVNSPEGFRNIQSRFSPWRKRAVGRLALHLFSVG